MQSKKRALHLIRLAREFCLDYKHAHIAGLLHEVRRSSISSIIIMSDSVLCVRVQVQCVLQDVGSHIATPRNVATEKKLGDVF